VKGNTKAEETVLITMPSQSPSVKAAMLLMLIIVGVISFAGGLSVKTMETAKENYGGHGNFDSTSKSSYGYAASFLSVIFAFGGFNQANYVSVLSGPGN
jgi:amino acid transporter